MKVEFLVSIKHPDDAEPMFLTEEQAKEVYDQLHAKFGDFDQARELSQLARESVARELRIAQLEATVKAYRSGPLSYGPGREAFEKYLEGGCSENGRVMRHEGMTLGPTCADPFPETGPSLQDDIEAMIAKASTDPTANLFDEIHEWQLATFPEASALSKFEHLKREIAELGEDITKPSEIADCMLLLIGLAKIQGINPIAAMREKLAVNKSRKWGEPDALGVVEHVREPDDADEQEAEFLSRLPLSEVCQLPPIKHPSNTPEAPAEGKGNKEVA